MDENNLFIQTYLHSSHKNNTIPRVYSHSTILVTEKGKSIIKFFFENN